MKYLGVRSKRAFLNPDNPIAGGAGSLWSVIFTPGDLNIQIPFEVYHAMLVGPANSQVLIYLDGVLIDHFDNGSLATYDPNIPMFVRPGQTIYYHWDSAVVTPAIGGPPNLSIFCREPLPF